MPTLGMRISRNFHIARYSRGITYPFSFSLTLLSFFPFASTRTNNRHPLNGWKLLREREHSLLNSQRCIAARCSNLPDFIFRLLLPKGNPFGLMGPKSNIEMLQEFQNRYPRIIVNATWYVINDTLHHNHTLETRLEKTQPEIRRQDGGNNT